jgi:hypothetical protein
MSAKIRQNEIKLSKLSGIWSSGGDEWSSKAIGI